MIKCPQCKHGYIISRPALGIEYCDSSDCDYVATIPTVKVDKRKLKRKKQDLTDT